MIEHDLKTWPGPFEQVAQGRKKHEVRIDDRNFQVGDTLLLREYNPRERQYTGRWISASITYVTYGGTFGLPDRLCVMSIEIMLCGGEKQVPVALEQSS